MQKSTTLRFKGKALALALGLLSVFSVTAQQYTPTNPPPAFPPSNVDRVQDRDQMCYQLGVTFPSLPPKDQDPNRPPDAYAPNGIDSDWTDSLGTGNTITRGGFGQWNNYHDEKVGIYTPIDLLKMKDGSKVTTAEQWWNSRCPEIEKDVKEQVWGVIPPDSILPKVTWSVVVTKGGSGSAAYIQKVITGTIDISRYPQVRNVPKISATLRIPANAAGKVPVMVCLGGDASTYYGYAQPQGWGGCGFDYSVLQPDNGAGLTSYLIGLVNKGNWRKPSDWGTLGAWAWGISRLIDYFETDPDVDATKIGVTGHSRNGKGTIVSMAYDKRVFIAYPSCAGSLGYKLFRRHYGQNLENHSWDQEYHWTAGNFFKWMGPLQEGQYLPRKVENSPVDGHSLLSLCAPRPVFGNSGNTGDTWQDYYGAFLSMRATSPVYELLGKKGIVSNDVKPIMDSAYNQGDLAFRWHNQGHTDAPDWPAFWRFASKYVKMSYLNYSASSFIFTDTTKKASFTLTSDTTWNITGPSWLTITPASGRLNGTINLSIQRNLTNAERFDTIRINAPGLKEQKIAVKQSAQTLSILPMIVAMADAADSKATLAVKSDTTWTVTVPAWLTADPTSGKLDGSVSITAQVNATGAIRTDTVRFFAPGLSERKVVINQGVSGPTFTVTLDNISVIAGANKDTLRITSNTVWTVANSATWVTADVAGGMNNRKVVLSVAANTGVSARTNTVTATAPGATPQEFVITQPGIAPTALWLNLSNFSFISSLNIGPGAYSNSSIWPGSNASSFSMSSSEPWLTIPSGANGTPSNFGGTYYLMPTIAASANTSASSRTANLILSYPGSATTLTLPVTQAGKIPDVILSKNVAMLSEAAQNDTTFITCDNTWTATKTQAWLTLKKTSGSAIDTLAVSVAANTGAVRVDTVKVVATGNTVPKYFVVRQQPTGSTLSVSRTSISLEAAINSTDTFKIKSNAAWSVTSSQPWLTASSASGSGNLTMKLTATAQNPNTPSTRSADITVSAVGFSPITINVVQKSAAPTLSVSDTELNLSSSSGTIPITIASNTAWTIKCSHSFVALGAKAGSGNAMVLLKVAQNPFSPVRVATITVSADGVTSKTIKLTQASAPATLFVLPLDTEFKPVSDSSYLMVNTNSTFTLSNADNWISLTPITNSDANSQVMAKVKAESNPTIEERTAVVKVSVPGLPLQSFTYIQAAGPATLSLSKSSADVDANESSVSFDISSNAAWSITSSETWVTSNSASGSSNGSVNLSVLKNPTAAARTATITVTVNGLAPQTVVINQAAGSGTSVNDIESDGIEIYPNPVLDKLSLKLPGKAAKITLHTLEGKELMILNTPEAEVDIDFSGYKPGVYFINITTDNKTISKKLVKL